MLEKRFLFQNLYIPLRALRLMAAKGPLPEELYRILACPICKYAVKYNKNNTALVCGKCKESYPIEKGIPIMLPKEQR